MALRRDQIVSRVVRVRTPAYAGELPARLNRARSSAFRPWAASVRVSTMSSVMADSAVDQGRLS